MGVGMQITTTLLPSHRPRDRGRWGGSVAMGGKLWASRAGREGRHDAFRGPQRPRSGASQPGRSHWPARLLCCVQQTGCGSLLAR